MLPAETPLTLRDVALAAAPQARWIADEVARIGLASLIDGAALAAPAETLRGRTVLLASMAQLPSVLALIALDGVAARLLLCPPDLDPAHLPAIAAESGVDAVVGDGSVPAAAALGVPVVEAGRAVRPSPPAAADRATEWVLFTSGTTGRPKLVRHSLASLAGPLDDGMAVTDGAVWSTFYDVRRYGGLQILLRALLGGGSMVLSSEAEEVGDFLVRAGAAGITHISGTPSHWRRALMSPRLGAIAPAYVRLSGEVADQAILDHLRAAFPKAGLAHAFASTEAGVAFDVRDGRAGFPAAYLDGIGMKAELRLVDGSLRIRSSRTASAYLGAARPLRDAEGFVDTGDIVERRGERCYFVGRREGVINVGGRKVYPEEVEAVLNAHPAVHAARAYARPSPITGAIVAAELVLRPDHDADTVKREVLAACRATLPAHKVPASLRAVDRLAIAATGKLQRAGA